MSFRKRSRIESPTAQPRKRSLVVVYYVFQKARPCFLLFKAAQESLYSVPIKTIYVSDNILNLAVCESANFGIPHYITQDLRDRQSQRDHRIQLQSGDFVLLFHPVHEYGLDVIWRLYKGQVDFLDILDLIAPTPSTTLPKMMAFLLDLLREMSSTKDLKTKLPPTSSQKTYISQQISAIHALDYDYHSILPQYDSEKYRQRFVLVRKLPDGETLDLIGSWRKGGRSYSDSSQADLRHVYYQAHGSHHQYIWLSAYRTIILEMSIFTPVTFKSEPRLEWILVQDLITYCQEASCPRNSGRFLNLDGSHHSCHISNRLFELYRQPELTARMLCSSPLSESRRIESPVEAPNMPITLALTALTTIAFRSICLAILS